MKRHAIAAVLVFLFILPLAGCNSVSSNSPQSRIVSTTALNQPVYPQFPQQVNYEDFASEDWEDYQQASNQYYEQLLALRGEGVSPDTVQALVDFAGRSTPLAIAGMEGENTVYSPLSLWSALAMLAQCAGGESRQEDISNSTCQPDLVCQDLEELCKIWTEKE